MFKVTDVMRDALVVASPDESVRAAASRMDGLRLECLPIRASGGDFIGLLTLWDVRRAHPNRLVIDAPRSRFLPIPASATIWEADEFAEPHGIEHFPVMDGENLVGIVSRKDLTIAVARTIDALTGLPTAAYLRHKASAMFSEGHDINLIFADINNFGDLNKRLGHAVGDRALLNVAHTLEEELAKDSDVLCRYGGDEFTVVTARGVGESHRLASSLVRKVAQINMTAAPSLSISIGVAGVRHKPSRKNETLNVDQLINLASRASTEAKRTSDGVLMIDVAVGV
jgi:IMP dehydrogenase